MNAPATLTDFLADFAKGQQAVHDATAWVEFEHDPKVPGRTGYRITGKTADVVQGAIDARHAEAERAGGVAEFLHPRRDKSGKFYSLGYINRTQPRRPSPSDRMDTAP